MTANAALYGPNDLSGISGMNRAEQTVMFNQVQRFTEKDVWLAKNAFESGTSNSVR